MGKYMSIDYGSVRVGIALSDESYIYAFGKIALKNDRFLIEEIYKIISADNVKRIIMGYPLNLKGNPTVQTKKVETFENELKEFFVKKNISIDILRWDERFSSKSAYETIINSGMKKKQRQQKEKIDIISAEIILQGYLDSLKYKK